MFRRWDIDRIEKPDHGSISHYIQFYILLLSLIIELIVSREDQYVLN